MTMILVVDDEPALRELLVDVLTDEGYTVLAAPDGRRALDLVPTERPALVLLDIMMPGLSGHEVVGRLREVPESPPVVLMSAGVVPDGRLAPPVVVFLPKPFKLDQLLATIARVLGRGTT